MSVSPVVNHLGSCRLWAFFNGPQTMWEEKTMGAMT